VIIFDVYCISYVFTLISNIRISLIFDPVRILLHIQNRMNTQEDSAE
jgi:hypothetical protein